MALADRWTIELILAAVSGGTFGALPSAAMRPGDALVLGALLALVGVLPDSAWVPGPSRAGRGVDAGVRPPCE